MQDHATALRAAERALFDRHALTAKEHVHTLARPAMRCRTLEIGAGRPTLFIHGGGGCGSLWAPLIAELPDVRAIVPDRPGFGLSEHVPLRGVDMRAHAVDFIAGVLDAFALDAVDIVANSMGALWSLWFERAQPGRVKSLSLLGAPAFVGGGSAPLPLRLLGRAGLGAVMMKLEPPSRRQVATLWHRMGHVPSEMSAEICAVTQALEEIPSYPRAWRDLLARCLTLAGPRPDMVFADDELARVACPLTYVWGAGDPFGSLALGRAAAERTPGARFVVVGRGHLPWLDAPAECARAIAGASSREVRSAA